MINKNIVWKMQSLEQFYAISFNTVEFKVSDLRRHIKLTFNILFLFFRNIRRWTLRRLSRRTRSPVPSWSWFWSSSAPWWWTGLSTSERPSWGRSSSRSSSSSGSTSGCSSSCRASRKSESVNLLYFWWNSAKVFTPLNNFSSSDVNFPQRFSI